MNDKHPITPPPELIQQWVANATGPDYEKVIATQAAHWGADQELEACCLWLSGHIGVTTADILREARRRPKPPSLKEQALAVITNSAICDHLSPQDEAIIRRALEALPE